VKAVLIDGEFVLTDGKLTTIDEKETIEVANQEFKLLVERAGREVSPDSR